MVREIGVEFIFVVVLIKNYDLFRGIGVMYVFDYMYLEEIIKEIKWMF